MYNGRQQYLNEQHIIKQNKIQKAACMLGITETVYHSDEYMQKHYQVPTTCDFILYLIIQYKMRFTLMAS